MKEVSKQIINFIQETFNKKYDELFGGEHGEQK